MIAFLNEDFARSEEILNANSFSEHVHQPFSQECQQYRGRRQVKWGNVRISNGYPTIAVR